MRLPSRGIAGVLVAILIDMRTTSNHCRVDVAACCSLHCVRAGLVRGHPPPPRAYHVAPQPGPDYEWVEGYWYPANGRYVWHQGYWRRPPYQGAYWVQPYYENGHYYSGRWEGRDGVIAHDHAWDHSKGRDENRAPNGNAHNRHGQQHNDQRR